MDRQTWTIQCGRKDEDSVFARVNSTEEEVKIIGAAIARYEQENRRKPVACIATKGLHSSFRENYDVLICDCM